MKYTLNELRGRLERLNSKRSALMAYGNRIHASTAGDSGKYPKGRQMLTPENSPKIIFHSEDFMDEGKAAWKLKVGIMEMLDAEIEAVEKLIVEHHDERKAKR